MAQPIRVRSFLVGIILGLAIGLPLGYLAGHPLHRSPWIDAGAPWVRLPQQQLVGPAPQTFSIPAKAYDYGAETKALGPLVAAAPSVLRVEVQASAGRVGVSLAKPDGSALVSKEQAVTPQMGKVSVYFRLGPEMGPVGVLVRNYDDEGAPGSITVSAVQVAPLTALTGKWIAAINRAGLN